MSQSLIFAANLSGDCATGSESIFGAIADWSVQLVDTLGGLGVVLAIGLETIIPFIPSEVILPLVGATAASGGNLTLFDGIFWAMVGVMLGAWLIYGISRWIGLSRVKHWAGKLPLISEEDIEIANTWFMSKGIWGVLIGRCVPIVRTVVSIPAGIGKMNFWLFSLFTFLGSLVWNCVLIGAGYSLGSNWCVVESFMDKFTWVVIIVFLLLIALYVYLKLKIKFKLKGAQDQKSGENNGLILTSNNSGTKLEDPDQDDKSGPISDDRKLIAGNAEDSKTDT
ncbi:MAG: DedA family protein [Bifidobacteriaceae bacterium]|jgi:membrane protein DedA with SNARE-associated domain|nr:DedA family protein [Bifidobacteriaceae bacterium]